MATLSSDSTPPQVKEGSLSTVTKILQYSPPEMLKGLLKNIAISSFIASLLASRESPILAVAVRLSELLMLKLPDIFTTMFLKEGVFFAMEQLANEAPAHAALEKKSKRSSSRLKVRSGSCLCSTAFLRSLGAGPALSKEKGPGFAGEMAGCWAASPAVVGLRPRLGAGCCVLSLGGLLYAL
jgi:hypothetical protein